VYVLLLYVKEPEERFLSLFKTGFLYFLISVLPPPLYSRRCKSQRIVSVPLLRRTTQSSVAWPRSTHSRHPPWIYEKINRSHTHTPTENNTPDTDNGATLRCCFHYFYRCKSQRRGSAHPPRRITPCSATWPKSTTDTSPTPTRRTTRPTRTTSRTRPQRPIHTCRDTRDLCLGCMPKTCLALRCR